jgi:uncharacterized membrane protein YecN with MAPEG domain
MTKLDAAAVYAGLNILILLALAFGVVMGRGRAKVMIGDGGDPGLLRAIRAHANATEYIPAFIAGLAIFALLDPAPLWAVHVLGIAFTIARVLHGTGLSKSEGRTVGRFLGTLVTWIAYVALGGGLVWAGLVPALGG